VAYGIAEIDTQNEFHIDRLINEVDFLMYKKKREMKGN